MSQSAGQTVNSVVKALKPFAFIVAAYAALIGFQAWQTTQSTYETSGIVLKIGAGDSLTSLSLGYFDPEGTPQAATLVVKNPRAPYHLGQELSFMASRRDPHAASQISSTDIRIRPLVFAVLAVGLWLAATALASARGTPKRRPRPAKRSTRPAIKPRQSTQSVVRRKSSSFGRAASSVRRRR